MAPILANRQPEELTLPFYWSVNGKAHFTVCLIRLSERSASAEVGC